MNKAEEVQHILRSCLYDSSKIMELRAAMNTPTEDATMVNGLTRNFGLQPEKVKEHREQIRALLDEMPRAFHKATGGGWSFLNLCNDKNGDQWTGLHSVMEELVVLAIAAGMGSYCLPREMWKDMPGAVPYVVFDTGGDE